MCLITRKYSIIELVDSISRDAQTLPYALYIYKMPKKLTQNKIIIPLLFG